MPSLTVKGFSCIESAVIDLQPITILIGPQASGKSVIAKLLYFFGDLLNTFYDFAESGDNFRLFKKRVGDRFSEWFPPSAWGKQLFEISYAAGPFFVKLSRRGTIKRPSDEVNFQFPEFFEEHYERVARQYRTAQRKEVKEEGYNLLVPDRTWRIREQSSRALNQRLGKEFSSFQIFVPAGRSFFTNLQKTIAIFEHGGQLDTVTKRFGRLFTQLIDGDIFFQIRNDDEKSKEFLTAQRADVKQMFGGDIKLSRNDRHVSTPDGRKVPLSVLSSGQQELLPLALTLQHYARLLAFRRKEMNLLFIEEPEAHLFPTTQGRLTTGLVALSNFAYPASRMLVTTHSPYVLAKLNTLIKAFCVAEHKSKLAGEVAKIVPEEHWVPPGRIGAYAINEGVLTSIKDDSGLIDGDYLDSISAEISGDFLKLLELEVSS